MIDEDWRVLLPKAENPLSEDELLEAIARTLETGTPSALFCKMLAGMIGPNGKNATPWRFKLVRRDMGRPKAPRVQLAIEMERLVDLEHRSVDEAVCLVQRKFGRKGYSHRTCEEALKTARDNARLMRLLDSMNPEAVKHRE